MNFKITTAMILTGMLAMPAFADDVVTSTAPKPTPAIVNASTLSASQVLSPGRYTATVAPSLDSAMTEQIEKGLKSIPGIKEATAHSDDSSIHFTVQKGARVRIADLQKMIAQADHAAVMTTPILENSLSPRPGL
jgi:hypothetical protein